MRPVIRKIDRALKALYNLDGSYNAEEFLIKRPLVSAVQRGVRVEKAANAQLQGALFIRAAPPARKNETPSDEISLGIYLSKGVRRNLLSFRRWPGVDQWSWEQLDAFSVAAEEVSHFQYLLFHASSGRPVSQLELELQGEIDKFLLTYFAVADGRKFSQKVFESLFEQFFFHFHLAESLTFEQRSRYLEANVLGRKFIRRCGKLFSGPGGTETALRALRRFYRMSAAEKISLAAA